MQSDIHSLFSSENLKCVEVNSFPESRANQKNFANGLQNALNILDKLEESLQKSNVYEKQLLQCKSLHVHTHDGNEWWDTDCSDQKDYRSSKTGNDRSSSGKITELWSTMTIVCLEHKYEELSNHYKVLLQAYDERCEAISNRDNALLKMRSRVKRTYAKLMNAHRTLLAVGEKYLALRHKMNDQKLCYEEKLIGLQSKLREVLDNSERARIEFDTQLAQCLADERDSDTAVLLYEIKKCNLLFLDNLRLKTQIEETASECFS